MSIFTLLPLLLPAAPFFRYEPPLLMFILFPFLTFFTLILVIRNKYKLWIPILGFLYILIASLFISGIITWPFHFQIDHTILANKHISDAILQHQQDALYLPFKLRPALFNGLVYIYFSLTHAFYFVTFSNLYDLFLLANLYPLVVGLINLVKNHAFPERLFILGGIGTTLAVIGFSRSVPESSILFVTSPLLIYLILIGLKEINIKWYLALLVISAAIQLNSLL